MINNNFLASCCNDNHLFLKVGWYMKFLKELHKHLCHCLRSILLNHMANVIHHNHLELALHVSNSQLFVQSIISCQEELLGDLKFQEALSQAGEPLCPVLFRG